MNAHYSETSDPGLSLVLFALVRSNPPATITFVDQSGQLVANTSDFLILDSRSYPWLTNHTLRVTLSSLSGNVSLNASNSVGTVQSNLTLAGPWWQVANRKGVSWLKFTIIPIKKENKHSPQNAELFL